MQTCRSNSAWPASGTPPIGGRIGPLRLAKPCARSPPPATSPHHTAPENPFSRVSAATSSPAASTAWPPKARIASACCKAVAALGPRHSTGARRTPLHPFDLPLAAKGLAAHHRPDLVAVDIGVAHLQRLDH